MNIYIFIGIFHPYSQHRRKIGLDKIILRLQRENRTKFSWKLSYRAPHDSITSGDSTQNSCLV